MAPFGVPEIVAAVAPAGAVLDAGCGSARLTLSLADAGVAEVVGIDTSVERLAQGRARLPTHPAGARVQLIEADFDGVLPFPDGRFSAAVSRLALMIATDPAATLRELRRVTAAGGRIVTALWAPVDDNPWFALPRAAAATVHSVRAGSSTPKKVSASLIDCVTTPGIPSSSSARHSLPSVRCNREADRLRVRTRRQGRRR